MKQFRFSGLRASFVALAISMAVFAEEVETVPALEAASEPLAAQSETEASKAPVAADSKAAKLEFSKEPLTADSKVVKAPLSEFVRLVVASYAEEMTELRAIPEPNAEQKARLARRVKEVKALLIAYDQAIKITPVVFTFSIQFGAEIPVHLLSKLPFLSRLKFGNFGGQYSMGLTMAMVQNRLTGRPQFAFALTQLAGGNFTVGKKGQSGLRPDAGITWIVPSIVVTVPMVPDVTAVTVGDLQGVFWGGAGELSSPAGETGKISRTVSLGVYVKPKLAFDFPDAGLIYFFHGIGGEVKGPSGQLEALWLSVLTSSDGSTFRNPIPTVGNNRTSPHADPVRYESKRAHQHEVNQLSPDEALERILEVQKELSESK